MFSKNYAPTIGRLDRVAKLYLAYKFFGALYFSYPIFYEYAIQAITPIQVGLFFSAIGICGLIAEIPTGIIADKRSRKFCGLLGMGFVSIAPLVIFTGHSFATYLIAAVFYGLGGAFLHGALDSLVYDHQNITKETYRRVNALEISYGQAGILTSAALGGFLFSISPGVPFVAQAIAGLVCLGVIVCMQERYKPEHTRSASSHAKHFLDSMKHLFATPYLRVLVLMGVVFSVMLGMSIQFVHEAAMIEYGLDGSRRGLLISGAGLTTIVLLNVLLLRLLTSDRARIFYIAGGAIVAYASLATGFMPFFLVGYLVWCCLNATSSFIRVLLQDHIPSSHRTTVLSGFKSLAVLIGLGASTGTGVLVQWSHTPRSAYLLFSVISCVVLAPCAIWLASHARHT